VDVAIDLGTANVLVYVTGRGIIAREPSVVAREKRTNRTLAIGEEARQMVGRTPHHIRAIRPLRDGVIADFDVTASMLAYFIKKAMHTQPPLALLLRPKPSVAICVPAEITSIEERAVRDAAKLAGADRVELVPSPLAAAIGAGLPIERSQGGMVVDIGGGTTDVAVMAFGAIVVGRSIRVAGDKLDEAIVRHIRQAHNLLIGERTAEEIKIKIGSVRRLEYELAMEVRGRDLVTGLPKSVGITNSDILGPLAEAVGPILEAIKAVLEQTPPELAGDIADHGIVLAGGGALLRGLDLLIGDVTRMATIVAEDPLSCAVIGTARRIPRYTIAAKPTAFGRR
jgi:rod shape-determining protein MreB and related proteins